ncbi:hypothetical protein M413DRAFT_121273 [Hebeloma cylindrosporum]|uniref:Uncharacterized protein n=1 Tax=Hebeloma cylindrosporum TaxID=76867 RepID=A0A0C2XYG2_HEBCY|nr:hypothetical protein M413DRAFT_121273 [Hebeloma cylindrosporum h7]
MPPFDRSKIITQPSTVADLSLNWTSSLDVERKFLIITSWVALNGAISFHKLPYSIHDVDYWSSTPMTDDWAGRFMSAISHYPELPDDFRLWIFEWPYGCGYS